MCPSSPALRALLGCAALHELHQLLCPRLPISCSRAISSPSSWELCSKQPCCHPRPSRHCSTFLLLDLKALLTPPLSQPFFSAVCPGCPWHLPAQLRPSQCVGLSSSSQQGSHTAFVTVLLAERTPVPLKNVYNLFIFVELRAISGTEHPASTNGHHLLMS